MNQTSRLTRSMAAFVLALALFMPWAAEAQPRSTGLCLVTPAGLPAPAELLARAWSLLSRLWNKEGCLIDPNGLEGGCGLDPDGLKEGCGLDPNGLDEGCLIDPDGRCIR